MTNFMKERTKIIFCVGLVLLVFSPFFSVKAEVKKCCLQRYFCEGVWTPDQCKIMPSPPGNCDGQFSPNQYESCPGIYLGQSNNKFYKTFEVDCAAEDKCKAHISQEIGKNCASKSLADCAKDALCFQLKNECKSVYDQTVCSSLNVKECSATSGGLSQVCKVYSGRCVSPLQAGISADNQTPDNYAGILPSCAFDGTCNDTNDLLRVVINAVKWVFGYIGAIALVFFLAGGFMIIISAGSEDRVKKGRDIMVSAVIGILISFSAYLMIKFLLDALQVSKEFRAVGMETPTSKLVAKK